MTRDPVCGAYVEPRTAHARMEHEGTTYYFCSERCQATFQGNPGQYTGKGRR